MSNFKKFNYIMVAIIVILVISIISFNYGYQFGERKGYVIGVQKCLDGMGEEHQQTFKQDH